MDLVSRLIARYREGITVEAPPCDRADGLTDGRDIEQGLDVLTPEERTTLPPLHAMRPYQVDAPAWLTPHGGQSSRQPWPGHGAPFRRASRSIAIRDPSLILVDGATHGHPSPIEQRSQIAPTAMSRRRSYHGPCKVAGKDLPDDAVRGFGTDPSARDGDRSHHAGCSRASPCGACGGHDGRPNDDAHGVAGRSDGLLSRSADGNAARSPDPPPDSNVRAARSRCVQFADARGLPMTSVCAFDDLSYTPECVATCREAMASSAAFRSRVLARLMAWPQHDTRAALLVPEPQYGDTGDGGGNETGSVGRRVVTLENGAGVLSLAPWETDSVREFEAALRIAGRQQTETVVVVTTPAAATTPEDGPSAALGPWDRAADRLLSGLKGRRLSLEIEQPAEYAFAWHAIRRESSRLPVDFNQYIESDERVENEFGHRATHTATTQAFSVASDYVVGLAVAGAAMEALLDGPAGSNGSSRVRLTPPAHIVTVVECEQPPRRFAIRRHLADLVNDKRRSRIVSFIRELARKAGTARIVDATIVLRSGVGPEGRTDALMWRHMPFT